MNTNNTITQKLQILLVENNTTDRMMLSKMMQATCNNSQLKYAEDMKDALTLASIYSFNFILIASTIPDNSNDIGLIAQCKMSSGKPHVIMLMPDARPHQLKETQKMGISDHLSKKDITPLIITKCFNHLLRLHQAHHNRTVISPEKRLIEIEGRLKTIISQLNNLLNVEKEILQDINTEIPVAERKAEQLIIAQTTKAEGYLSQFHILIAEDNDINRFIIEKMITKLGLQMTFTSNGIDTITQFTSSKFDMVLMDIEMPGMNGYEASKTIREELKNTSVPIIAMTAHSSPDEKEKCIRSGMNDYLSKPFKEETLRQMISKWQPVMQSNDKNN